MRGTKGYKSMSEERLISSITESKPAKKIIWMVKE